MKRVDLLQMAWLIVVLAALALSAAAFAHRERLPLTAAGAPANERVTDMTGRVLPIAHYRRIASASGLADRLLLELCEPERILALSHYGRVHDLDRHKYGARPDVSGPADIERLIGMNADLLIVNHLGAEAELARARASGIPVFDLGEMRGLASLQPDILALATLLGDRARGERLWRRVSRGMAAVASDIPKERRRRALYLAIYAGKVYGGTIGTSYHDVLEAAGLIDIAASGFKDWPQYDTEQLLALDPSLVITDSNMGRELCSNEWLKQLRACRERDGIVELPEALIGDSGLGMLDAAQELRVRVYGPSP
ncbi:MAG TPA: ABC transporter substrate-binding protein [Polyangiales bacterium]|jgi:iron complex transport system substrate-binding protein